MQSSRCRRSLQVLEIVSLSKQGIAEAMPSHTLTLVTSAAFALLLIVLSLLPLPSVLRSKRKYAPIVVLVLMELALIGTAVAFQVLSSWLNHARLTERF